MVDVTIVNETSPEANWNWQAGRQAGGQAGRQTCVLGGCASKNYGIFLGEEGGHWNITIDNWGEGVVGQDGQA